MSEAEKLDSRFEGFRFEGSGGELFRIWIANLFLSILTLGIYSAWAKVRTNRYLWSNTRLGDSGFAYLANPIAILKGRLLVLGFFGLNSVVVALVPPIEPFFGILLLVLVPWAVVRSMMFRARNTSYRNLRFDFRGTYGEAASAFIWRPLLLPFTLGLAYPWMIRHQKKFVIEGSAFGITPFSMGAKTGEFFGIYVRALGLLIVGGVTLGLAATQLETIGPILAGVVGAPLYLFLFAFVSAETTNLVYGNTALGEHRFESRVRAAELFGLYVTNTLAILATLGIFIPWAQVRMMRYRLDRLAIASSVDLDTFVATQLEEVESAGAEFGDVMDLDLGL